MRNQSLLCLQMIEERRTLYITLYGTAQRVAVNTPESGLALRLPLDVFSRHPLDRENLGPWIDIII